LITSSDVVFDGMGHSINGSDAAGTTGIYVTGNESIANVTIRNVTVRHWGSGVRIGDVSETMVADLLAEVNTVGLEHNATTGTTGTHTVRDSVFRLNTGTGIVLSYPAEGVAVLRCRVLGNGAGIETWDSGRVDAPDFIADCEVSENTGDGVALHEGKISAFQNCTVSGNGNDGVLIEHSVTELAGNRIEANGRYGVNAGDRGGSDIHGNRIEGNAIGLSTGGDWPSRVRNNVINNTDNGYFGILPDSGYLNYTKTAGPNIVGGPYLGGNYWAFPNGPASPRPTPIPTATSSATRPTR
jgi:hypothetical protein